MFYSLATEQTKNEKVAIKRLKLHNMNNFELKRTYRELYLLKQLNHKNVSLKNFFKINNTLGSQNTRFL